MSTLAQALERSAIARWGSGASIVVVLAAGLFAAAVKPGERPGSQSITPPMSVVAPARASTVGSQTAVTAPARTIPGPAPTTTARPRVTPPFQSVPDDPSATVPPPVRGIDLISGD